MGRMMLGCGRWLLGDEMWPDLGRIVGPPWPLENGDGDGAGWCDCDVWRRSSPLLMTVPSICYECEMVFFLFHFPGYCACAKT